MWISQYLATLTLGTNFARSAGESEKANVGALSENLLRFVDTHTIASEGAKNYNNKNTLTTATGSTKLGVLPA